MKKAAVIAGLFFSLFLGSVLTAQAGTRYSFGFSFGVGPAVPYNNYCYPAYPPYYADYYAYPYYYHYPSYRTYVVPRYYSKRQYRSYEPRYYRDRRDYDRRDGRSNSRSRSGSRWRY